MLVNTDFVVVVESGGKRMYRCKWGGWTHLLESAKVYRTRQTANLVCGTMLRQGWAGVGYLTKDEAREQEGAQA